jgi:hypothetical protein
MIEERSTYERTDISPRAVTWFAVGLVASCIVISVALLFFKRALQQAAIAPPEGGRTTMPYVAVPPPVLQVTPAADLEQMRTAEETILHGYGWVDRDAGIIRIPIERAIEHTAERGLPARDGPAPGQGSQPKREGVQP